MCASVRVTYLVLEPRLGHGKVDEGRLGLQLGRIVRIRQLRLQVELEERLVGRVARGVLGREQVDLVVAQLDDELAPLGDDGAGDDGLERRACPRPKGPQYRWSATRRVR